MLMVRLLGLIESASPVGLLRLFLPQPVAVAADRHHMALVQQSIEDCYRHHPVPEDLRQVVWPHCGENSSIPAG
jgi:hypothetical protein